MTRKRSRLDFYPTPGWAADVLWERLPMELHRRHQEPEPLTWAEPCVGAGDIITARAPRPLWTSDVDVTREATFHLNACHLGPWEDTFPAVDWIVSNPPFNVAIHVIRNARLFARRGVAMLLRLSWLEPVEERRGFLELMPPHRLIVLPRISFDGSGNTDSVTCAWMIWGDRDLVRPGIEVVKGPTKLADIEGP